jgi:hypothetical protein
LGTDSNDYLCGIVQRKCGTNISYLPNGEKILSLIRGEYSFLAKGHIYFSSPEWGENFISHKGRIFISRQRAHISFISQKGGIYISSQSAYVISQWGENIFEPIGLDTTPKGIYIQRGDTEIIYFRTKCPNKPYTVAFLACEGFSHRVFPT